MKKQKSPHPAWATAYRKPGTELRFIRNRYYLYAVSSKYDPSIKRARKITGKLLGTITKEDGFMKSEKRILVEKASKVIDLNSISVREYGFTAFLKQYNQVIEEKLKEFLPTHYLGILYMAYSRLVHQSPLKNMGFHINKSMLSVNDTKAYNEKYFSILLREIGSKRQEITAYMKSFTKANDYVLFDMTNLFSASQNHRYAQEGYNSEMIFDKQINLMYIYSPSLVQPVFYRLFAGNIREVKGFKICLLESGIKDAIVIADKGFYSQTNIDHLQQENLQYIIPLRRDNLLIAYDKLEKKSLSYFKFEDRYIWHTTYTAKDKQVFLFKDDQLKVQEEKDYLDRIITMPEYYQIEAFHQKLDHFGTIAFVSNIPNTNAEHIYTCYKSRNNIEVMFDGIKNIMHADRTYMQNDQALEGWMLINHIALQWYYIIYSILKENTQLKRFSVRDFVRHLYEIKKVKINNEWELEPITKASALLLEKLDIHIT